MRLLPRMFGRSKAPNPSADPGIECKAGTPTRRSSRSLSQSHWAERLALAQRAAHFGLFDWDLLTGKIEWTPELQALFGIEPGSFPGTYEAWRAMVHPEDLVRLEQQKTDWLQSTSLDGEFEYRIIRPDDVIRHLILQGKLLRNELGLALRMIGCVRDCTEETVAKKGRKQIEDELRRSREELRTANQQLEAQVAERTAELQRFSHAMMHDLRAPLRAIHSFATILEQDCPACRQPPFNSFLERIQKAALRMDDLIRDSLNYSKLLHKPLPLAKIELNELLEELLSTYADFQPPNLDVWIEPKLPAVLGNSAALTECFSNLLSNAVKYARTGVPPKVRIFSERLNENRRIYVQDNGIGIAPEQTAKLFDLFVRLEQTPDASTGIGLAIVRKAAERMDGRVGVFSVPGEGSRFWIELHQPHDS